MLNAEAFGQCRPGVQVVNVARGGVVDEDDLLQALDSGQCGGAALDVYSVEPLPADHPLRRHPKVLLSPHLGASTQEAQQAVSIDAAAAALAYLRGERIRGAVNAGGLKIDLSSMQRRYSDLGTRMARLISPMITRGIAEVGITICGEHLGAAQSMIERSALCGLLCEHLSEPVNIINVNQVAESRGIRVRTSVVSEGHAADQLELEVTGPRPDRSPPPPDLTRRIVGRVYDDLKPRVVEINGYHMDMVPAGEMILIQNEDKPGIIGLVGTAMGRAGVNIADMSISRREAGGDVTAMMVLKIDGPASRAQLGHIETQPGILKVAAVRLPAETP